LRRIGILGGTFDPPHAAHLALARCALEELVLDELLWVPAGQPWQKAGVSVPAHRAAMVELALQAADEPRFRLERCELERPGPSFMVDTVLALRARPEYAECEWFLLMGQDQYDRLHTWHRWADLLGLVTVAVAVRPTANAPVNIQPPAGLLGHPHRRFVLNMPPLGLSSSQIRERCARGDDVRPWVCESICRYIDHNHLYRNGQRADRS
jgi:nicotinate-nucleotide adenylyltransferase